MMYSAYKLNKQGDNIQPDVLLSQFGTSLLFYVWVLTSIRPENRFCGRKVKCCGIPISLRISPQFGVIHTNFVGISYRKANLSFFAKFFFYFIFKLYITVLVLPNIKMNPPQVYMCSPSRTLLPPPSPFHPTGSSQCTSPKHPVSCIELVEKSLAVTS